MRWCWPWHRGSIVLGRQDPGLPLLAPSVRLSPRYQQQSATIWGKSGSGKSKLLQSIFLQHLRLGHGVGLIEPHGDLSHDILSTLVAQGVFQEADALDRLIYVDWGNGYVPFNVLAGHRDPQVAALHALEAMIRVWPELAAAPMFQTLFLSGVTVLARNGRPITDLYRLLTDGEFLVRCLRRTEDPLIHYALESYQRLGRHQTEAAGSALRRAFLLSFSKPVRYSVGQPENWLDFRRLMDRGVSFIHNLGNIQDQETRNLIGALLLVQIEQAALSRADVPPEERRPYTLLVDEWPAFAAGEKTIGTILSQTRKYRLQLVLAAQSISQISSLRLVGALENCGVTISFGLGRMSAEAQARHIGRADPFAVKEEAPTERQHNQFMSIVDQFELLTGELQNLPPRVAYLKLPDRPAVRFKTSMVPTARADPAEVAHVLRSHRKRYQRTQEEAQRAIDAIALDTTALDTTATRTAGDPRSTPPAPAFMRLFQSADRS